MFIHQETHVQLTTTVLLDQDESEMTDCKSCSDGEYNDQLGEMSCKFCSGTISADRTTCNQGGNGTCQPG